VEALAASRQLSTRRIRVFLPAWAALLLVGLTHGCGSSGTSPAGPTGPAAPVLRLETAHFRVHADQAADSLLREIADRLEAELPRVAADLAVSGVRPVTVKVWQDEAAWGAEVQRYFGRRIDTAGYITGPDELRVLAVSQVARNAVHELAHCLSLYVNPTFANNPRWLWESVALYENRELVDPRTLSYLVQGRPPTLAQLDVDVTAWRQVYEVGYLIGEFVVARGGLAGLRDLIRTNGNTLAVLGLSSAQFEAAWYAWVRERYLS
jgi:hypothetical protein